MTNSNTPDTNGSCGALVRAVQTNCNIADARHAADLSLCIYLLQMREFYRWEQGLGFNASLNRDAIGQWLAGREALWGELEARPFEALQFGGEHFEPLDAAALNTALAPVGLVYGAGLAGIDRPVFFLAHRHATQQRDGLTLQVCGQEYARGLFAPPAALAGDGTIVLRRESLARWLWERFEAFSLHRAGLAVASPGGAFQALVQAHALHDSAAFVNALPRLVDELCETLVLHELGEHRAGLWLGPGWAAMRMDLGQRRTELAVRAVRDHLADLEVTLPTLLASGSASALHFWFANYEGLRQRLFPALAQGYADWRGGDAGAALLRATRAGVAHFRRMARQILALHARLGSEAGPAIQRLLAAPEAVCAGAP